MKHIITILTVAAFLTGCSGKEDTILKAHNAMVSAEQTYTAEVRPAIETSDFDGLVAATTGYLQAVQNIDVSDCPDDYKQAMKGLENSLNDIKVYLSGINNIASLDPTKFPSLQDARMDATRNLNGVARSHGLQMTPAN